MFKMFRMFYLPNKSAKEKILDERKSFEEAMRLNLTGVGLLFDFDKEKLTYKDDTIHKMFYGWCAAKNIF